MGLALYYEMYYNIFDSKGETMKRKLITVRLDDGYVLKISNRAKKNKKTFSHVLRQIIQEWCIREIPVWRR
jgi:hypothetical protein